MPEDYRLKVGFLRHPKTERLRMTVGPDGVLSLVTLVEFCTITAGRADGIFDGMDTIDIEIAAGWRGGSGELVGALLSVGFLEYIDEHTMALHDFAEHNPWAANADQRRATARANASKRWAEKYKQEAEDTGDSGQCADGNAVGIKIDADGNAPLPSSPTQLQTSSKTNSKTVTDIQQVVEHFKTYAPKTRGGKTLTAPISARLREGSTVEELCDVIDKAQMDKWHQDTGKAYDLKYLMREDVVTRLLNQRQGGCSSPRNHSVAEQNLAVLREMYPNGNY